MDIAELRERDGVLSAARNQHATVVTCATHQDALDVQHELGGEISRARHWTVTSPSNSDESDSEQQPDDESG